MAVPDTLTAWRTFVAHHPVQPSTLTPRRLRALSPTETADYHAQRIAWLAADVVLETPHITTLERQMRILLARNNSYSATARRGLAQRSRRLRQEHRSTADRQTPRTTRAPIPS